jgi:hypothetical protein
MKPMNPFSARMSIPLVVFIAGCASACPRSDDGTPLLKVKVATEIVAKVDSFKGRGAFIDFSDAFIEYHTVYLWVEKAPESMGWGLVGLQYQGLPMIDGRRLEFGQRLRLTVVPSKDQCCGPYLNEATNVEFLPAQ